MDQHENIDRFEEHGQDWAACMTCGASWSVHETNTGEILEMVSEGDGYCDE